MARTRAEGLATGAKPWTPAKAVAAIASMENFMVTRLVGLYDEEMVPRFVIVRDVGKDEASGRCVFLATRALAGDASTLLLY